MLDICVELYIVLAKEKVSWVERDAFGGLSMTGPWPHLDEHRFGPSFLSRSRRLIKEVIDSWP